MCEDTLCLLQAMVGTRIPWEDECQDQPAVNCPGKPCLHLDFSVLANFKIGFWCKRWEDNGGRTWRRLCRSEIGSHESNCSKYKNKRGKNHGQNCVAQRGPDQQCVRMHWFWHWDPHLCERQPSGQVFLVESGSYMTHNKGFQQCWGAGRKQAGQQII